MKGTMVLGEWARRVWYLLNRARRERELELEMAAHREMMGEPHAFGNALRLREEARDAWGWNWLDHAWQDVHQALRVLRAAPGFAFAATLILSAGIGLNLTFFHLLNVAVLRPPAIKEPATLVRFMRNTPTFSSTGLPYPATEFIREHNQVFSAVLTQMQATVHWNDDPDDRLRAAFVSANWFTELGYGAAIGRVFSEDRDARADAPPVAVVSHEFWRARLSGAADAIGRTIRVNGRPATLIGVAPARFPGLRLEDTQVWMPIRQVEFFTPGIVLEGGWTSHNTELYGRLRPGVSQAAAAEALRTTITELARVRPKDFHPDERLEPSSGDEHFRFARDKQELLSVVTLVGALTLLVLVVASANLGNLVLSRSIGRVREFSVRCALGGSRWRILRHLIVEAGLLAAAGAVGGILLGYWGGRLLAIRTEVPSYVDLSADWRLVALGTLVAFAAMLAFGVIPAWIVSRRDLTVGMRDGGQQTSSGLSRARFRKVLVGAQVAGCCVLLIVAAGLTRGLQRLLPADLGFHYERIVLMQASLERAGIRGEAARQFWTDVAGTLAPQPEVEQLVLAWPPPLGDLVQESIYQEAPQTVVSTIRVQPSFFSVMEIPILAGRDFMAGDDPRVAVIVSRRLALAIYGTLDVLGKGFPRAGGGRTIVGVVGDAPVVRPRPTGVAEQYEPLDRETFHDAVLIARARQDPRRLLVPMRAAATSLDARVTANTRLLRDDYEDKLRGPRLASLLAGVTGLLALTLACLGIFAVVAYAVALRTKEIGIRRALGAGDAAIVRLVLRQLTWPVAVGTLLGSGGGIVAATLLARPPFHIASTDPAGPAAALAIFLFVALTAALLPARRALGSDPVHALRQE